MVPVKESSFPGKDGSCKGKFLERMVPVKESSWKGKFPVMEISCQGWFL